MISLNITKLENIHLLLISIMLFMKSTTKLENLTSHLLLISILMFLFMKSTTKLGN